MSESRELKPTQAYHVEIEYTNHADLKLVVATLVFGHAGLRWAISQRNLELIEHRSGIPAQSLHEMCEHYIRDLDTGDPYKTFWLAHHRWSRASGMSCLNSSKPLPSVVSEDRTLDVVLLDLTKHFWGG